jgi:26S proteasome regulatory subunit N2
MPNVDYISNAPPSIFAYPPALVDKKQDKKEKIETVVLSITAKQKKRDLEKKHEEITPMETVRYLFKSKSFIHVISLFQETVPTNIDDKVSITEPEKEPEFELLLNPTRVVKAQVCCKSSF